MTDAEISPVLRAHLAQPGALVLDERGAGTCRVDLVVVGAAALHAVEIKSERDSLRRLAAQAAAFSSIFDRATLSRLGGRRMRSMHEVYPLVCKPSRGPT